MGKWSAREEAKKAQEQAHLNEFLLTLGLFDCAHIEPSEKPDFKCRLPDKAIGIEVACLMCETDGDRSLPLSQLTFQYRSISCYQHVQRI